MTISNCNVNFFNVSFENIFSAYFCYNLNTVININNVSLNNIQLSGVGSFYYFSNCIVTIQNGNFENMAGAYLFYILTSTINFSNARLKQIMLISGGNVFSISNCIVNMINTIFKNMNSYAILEGNGQITISNAVIDDNKATLLFSFPLKVKTSLILRNLFIENNYFCYGIVIASGEVDLTADLIQFNNNVVTLHSIFIMELIFGGNVIFLNVMVFTNNYNSNGKM